MAAEAVAPARRGLEGAPRWRLVCASAAASGALIAAVSRAVLPPWCRSLSFLVADGGEPRRQVAMAAGAGPVSRSEATWEHSQSRDLVRQAQRLQQRGEEYNSFPEKV